MSLPNDSGYPARTYESHVLTTHPRHQRRPQQGCTYSQVPPTFPLPRACTDGYDRSYPLAPGEQYRYRYPLMLHDTPESFPPTPAFGPEFARFDSLQNAMNWMKEQDAGEYMLEQFKGVGL